MPSIQTIQSETSTETHYLRTVPRTNGTALVIRRAGGVRVATITKLHRGWELDLGAGIRRSYDRKVDCFFAAVNHDNNR